MAYTNLISLFKAICDAIRSKAGITGSINHQDIPAKIAAIKTPSDGSIPTKTSSDLAVSGATVTVPSGYYASAANKSVATATQATPSISVNSDGKITASTTQAAGYVSAGTKSAEKQLTTQAAKTVTPTTEEQTAVNSGVYTTGAVKVGAIPSNYIVPSNTKTITTNGTHDVKSYASASVNVPIPNGYVYPSGNKSITSNGTGIDVKNYATVSVDVPVPSGYVYPSHTVTSSSTTIEPGSSYSFVSGTYLQNGFTVNANSANSGYIGNVINNYRSSGYYNSMIFNVDTTENLIGLYVATSDNIDGATATEGGDCVLLSLFIDIVRGICVTSVYDDRGDGGVDNSGSEILLDGASCSITVSSSQVVISFSRDYIISGLYNYVYPIYRA